MNCLVTITGLCLQYGCTRLIAGMKNAAVNCGFRMICVIFIVRDSFVGDPWYFLFIYVLNIGLHNTF
jgi:hypothetical protein